jgi:hypothetical protein
MERVTIENNMPGPACGKVTEDLTDFSWIDSFREERLARQYTRKEERRARREARRKNRYFK